MSNKDEVTEKFKELQENGMKNMHISWGPEAYKLSEEEAYGYVSKVMDEVKRHNSLTHEEKMLEDLETIYVDVKHAFNCVSYNRINTIEYDEAIERIHAAWGSLEFALLHLGNWIQNNQRLKLDIDVENKHKVNSNEKFYHKQR